MTPTQNLRAVRRNTGALVIQCMRIAAKGPDHRTAAMRGKAKRLRFSIQGRVNALGACALDTPVWPMFWQVRKATDDVLAACRRVLNGGAWDGGAAWLDQDMAINLLMRRGRWG